MVGLLIRQNPFPPNQEKKIIVDRRLRERNYGIFQGSSPKTIREKFPLEYEAHSSDDEDYVIPEGESKKQFQQRCITCFEEISRKHLGEQILIVSHGGFLITIVKYVLGIPISSTSPFKLFNASINIVSLSNDEWILETLGDICHLNQTTFSKEKAFL